MKNEVRDPIKKRSIKEKWSLRHIFLFLGIMMTTFLVTGCDSGGLMPPASISFRYSYNIFAASTRVMQVTNRSGKETLVMRLDVRNEKSNESGSYSFKVRPGSTYEIGILEMGWAFMPGEKYSIRADGYLFPIDGTVP